MSLPSDPSPELSTLTPIQEYEMFQNRINVALAKQKRMVRGWMEDMYKATGKPMPPQKSEEELDKEDAKFLNFWEPPHLGLGAAIPKEYYNEKGELIRKEMTSMEMLATIPDLRPIVMRIQAKEGVLAGKAKAAREKAMNTKTLRKEVSSDEEEGRSGLGKAKKSRYTLNTLIPNSTKLSHASPTSLTPLESGSFVTGQAKGADAEGRKILKHGLAEDDGKESINSSELNVHKTTLLISNESDPSDKKARMPLKLLNSTETSAHSDSAVTATTTGSPNQEVDRKKEKNRLKKAKKKARKQWEKQQRNVTGGYNFGS